MHRKWMMRRNGCAKEIRILSGVYMGRKTLQRIRVPGTAYTIARLKQDVNWEPVCWCHAYLFTVFNSNLDICTLLFSPMGIKSSLHHHFVLLYFILPASSLCSRLGWKKVTCQGWTVSFHAQVGISAWVSHMLFWHSNHYTMLHKLARNLLMSEGWKLITAYAIPAWCFR